MSKATISANPVHLHWDSRELIAHLIHRCNCYDIIVFDGSSAKRNDGFLILLVVARVTLV